LAGARDSNQGVELSTQTKRSCHWELWLRFLKYIELHHDPFLDNIAPWCRPRLGVAFARAYRAGQFATKGKNSSSQQVSGDSVSTALGNVAATFRAHDRPDPFLDQNGQRHQLLQQQCRAYKKFDPKAKQQKAVPSRVIRRAIQSASSEREQHEADLVGGAFFFACRSCEYSEVQGERKTKTIEVGNIQFFKGKRELSHLDPYLLHADSVSITFVLQKNNTKYDTITQWATNDKDLCPVQRWGRLVQRIRSYPGSTDATPVNLFRDPKTLSYHYITSSNISSALRRSAEWFGVDDLGFQPKELGTHSIRSGAAMAMYLTQTPVYTIMLIGRWSSDAFLRYIRTQVQDFARGVSQNMIQAEDFFTVPQATSLEDPRTSNHHHNFSGRGMISGLTDAARPLFSLFH